MNVVVDASAIAAIVFEEPEGDAIRTHLEHNTLIAPHLIDTELANVALVKIRRRLANELLIRTMLSAVPRLDIRHLPIRADEVVALALRTGLSAYDASYLWLALQQDVELVTLDRELARADRSLRGEPT
jgi:predicted nucleic acid-binding protein